MDTGSPEQPDLARQHSMREDQNLNDLESFRLDTVVDEWAGSDVPDLRTLKPLGHSLGKSRT
jgi:hypothetical protein